jgi:hypothetical protein
MLGIIFIFFMESAHAELQFSEKYQSVTIESFKDLDPSVRASFFSCIANWKLHVKKTEKLHEALIQMKSADTPDLILEVGNSGFGGYDFIIASGGIIRSSFVNSEKKGSKELRKLFVALDMKQSQDFDDPGSPDEDDGNCYFLMIRKNGIERRAAVYGTPGNTKVGLIIKKMLSLTAKKR